MEYKYIKYRLKYLNLLNIMQKGSSLSPEQTEINDLFYHLLDQTNIITPEISDIINNITEILIPYDQIIIIDSLNFASIEQDEEIKLNNIKIFINTNYDKIIKWFNDNHVPIYYLHLFYNLITLLPTKQLIPTIRVLDEIQQKIFDNIKNFFDIHYKKYYETKHKIESVKNLIKYYDDTEQEKNNRNKFIIWFNEFIEENKIIDEITKIFGIIPVFKDLTTNKFIDLTKDELNKCYSYILIINDKEKIHKETNKFTISTDIIFINYMQYVLADLNFNKDKTKIICSSQTTEFISIIYSLLYQLQYEDNKQGFLIIQRQYDNIVTYNVKLNLLLSTYNIIILNTRFKNIKYKEIDDYFVLIFKYLFYKLGKRNTITISGDNYGWTANLTFIQETHDNFNFINKIKNVNKINPDNFIKPFISTYYGDENPDDESYHKIRIRKIDRTFDDFYVRNFDSEKNVFSFDIINETGRHPIKPIIISKRHRSPTGHSPTGHSYKKFRI